MKPQNIYLILTLIGILILTLISQNKPTLTGVVESISKTNYKTTIHLQNQSTELIIFEKLNINLNPGDRIRFQGKADIYKGKSQIIISHLSKTK